MDVKPVKDWKLPWVAPQTMKKVNFDSAEYAKNLHSSVLDDVKKRGYDICGDRYFPESDVLFVGSKDRVRAAEIFEKELSNGPSAIREQFSSKDWRTWNEDLTLLEAMSKRDIKREIVIEKPKPIRPKNYKGPGLYFAAPVNPNIESLAAAFAAPSTSVKHILTESLNQQLPTYDPAIDSVLDPYSIGLHPCKGGAATSASAHVVSGINTTTQNCDIPPVDKPRSEKGPGKFNSSSRFIHAEPQANPPPTPLVDTVSGNSTIAVTFPKDKRFRVREDSEVAPGPGSYNVRMYIFNL